MHVTVNRKDLLRVLGRCQGVADKKSTMPVLGNVLLDAKDALRLAATDLYLSVSGEVAATVQKSGGVAVGARDLFERVKMMPDGPITIEVNDAAQTTLRAVGSARRYTLHGLPAEDFPPLPQPDESAPLHSLPVASLSRLIAATHFSVSTDETRLHLNSALFEWEGRKMRMVSTDGHRLSRMDLAADASATLTMLVPLKGVLELRRLCDDARSESSDGVEITMVQSGPNAFFHVAGLRFSVKLVDAQFPPYQQVIPEDSERVVKLPRAEVIEALKAVSVAASDRTGGVKVTLSKGTLRLATESPESGEGFDELSVDYDGPEITVGFNARYVVQVLEAIDDESITIGMSGELDPAVIRPATESDKEAYLAVIMPMRI